VQARAFKGQTTVNIIGDESDAVTTAMIQ